MEESENLVIGIAVAVVILAIIVIAVAICFSKKCKNKDEDDVKTYNKKKAKQKKIERRSMSAMNGFVNPMIQPPSPVINTRVEGSLRVPDSIPMVSPDPNPDTSDRRHSSSEVSDTHTVENVLIPALLGVSHDRTRRDIENSNIREATPKTRERREVHRERALPTGRDAHKASTVVNPVISNKNNKPQYQGSVTENSRSDPRKPMILAMKKHYPVATIPRFNTKENNLTNAEERIYAYHGNWSNAKHVSDTSLDKLNSTDDITLEIGHVPPTRRGAKYDPVYAIPHHDKKNSVSQRM